MKRILAAVTLFFMMCAAANADSIGVRGAVADTKSDEDFDAYEMFVVLDLPWAWRDRGTSRIQSQIELTGGVLDTAGQTGFLGTLGPRLAYTGERYSLDVGVGVAVLGETEFGRQDFGGSSQFIAQAGFSLGLTDRIDAGVRFRHMSDADMHHGEDLNLVLLEMSYEYLQR
ncbi:MAG TPA: acyloxyacyl hydrolase [Arenicellales bacterium]|nr:acyloxyacyl hydrolase [Arenicellales bacterium]